MTTPPSDREILASLAAGEPAAYAALYERLSLPLFRVATAMLSNRHAAEDAVHDLFLSLARHRNRIGEVRDLDAYAFACLRNSIKAVIARRQSERRHLLHLSKTFAEESSPPPLADDELTAALAKLPGEQREIVSLKVDGRLTFAQIGQVLGISMNTAASRYRYALEKLRRWLEEER